MPPPLMKMKEERSTLTKYRTRSVGIKIIFLATLRVDSRNPGTESTSDTAVFPIRSVSERESGSWTITYAVLLRRHASAGFELGQSKHDQQWSVRSVGRTRCYTPMHAMWDFVVSRTLSL